MNKENLIVCGCSFTKGHFLSENETWGGYVANKLNLNLHNIAIGGMGNEFISTRTISYLLNNKELSKNSIVMIGWSEMSRLTGTFENFNGYIERVTIRPDDFGDDSHAFHGRSHWPDVDDRYHGYVKKNHKYIRKFFSSFAYCIYKTYYSIYTLKHFLESNNIPYIFFDAINNSKMESIDVINTKSNMPIYKLKWIDTHGVLKEIEEFVPEWMIDELLNDNVKSLIFDNSNYIYFDGVSMLAYMNKFDYELLTDGNPGHPNLLAADMFSNMIIDEYKKIYNL
jgi:hypothetical protein